FTGAQGAVSVFWSNSFGDDSLSATAASGATTAFTGSVSTAERKQAIFSWVATDGVNTRVGTVAATILHNI
ncbi:MAG: hypothetical protein JWM76_1428, partial [Pseudonocardiales bacterium]|nr:hypothetical protein [Pseudonocardiales bacterium]MDB5420676.1 hypothetical protein [Brevundimonas sp.]